MSDKEESNRFFGNLDDLDWYPRQHNQNEACKICGKSMPFTAEYFVPTKNKAIMSHVCRNCNNMQLDSVRPEAIKAQRERRKHKVCSKCGKEKLKEEFNRDRNNKIDGRQCWCRDCQADYRKEHSDNEIIVKKCSKCQQIKSIHDFQLNITSRDGHQHYCRQCIAEYGAEYRAVKKAEAENHSNNIAKPYKVVTPLNCAPRRPCGDEPILLVEMPTGNGQIELVMECPLAKDTISWIIVQLDRIIKPAPSVSINGMKIHGACEITKIRDICDEALKEGRGGIG